MCRLWLSGATQAVPLFSVFPLPGIVSSAPSEAYRFRFSRGLLLVLLRHSLVLLASRTGVLTVLGYLPSVLGGGIGWS